MKRHRGCCGGPSGLFPGHPWDATSSGDPSLWATLPGSLPRQECMGPLAPSTPLGPLSLGTVLVPRALVLSSGAAPGTPAPCSYLRSATRPRPSRGALPPLLGWHLGAGASPAPARAPSRRGRNALFSSAVSPSTDFVGWHEAGPDPIRPSSPPFLRIAAKPHLCYSLLRPLIYVQTLVHPANSYLDSNSVF